MAKALTAQQQGNVNLMRGIIANENIKSRVNDILGKEGGTFLASCMDLYTQNLTGCDPNAVMAQCMKAAALHLPVSNALGFCYVVPYKGMPTFTIGYRGLIQLAQRTGQYKYLNADVVFEGETVVNNRITGMVEISGNPTSDNVIGYFAYFQLMNGFEKCIYWTKERVMSHARKYSKAFEDGPWQNHFDEMALKTMIRQLISKYGVMSIEFVNAVSYDNEEETDAEVEQNANGTPISLDALPGSSDPLPKENVVDVENKGEGEPDF